METLIALAFGGAVFGGIFIFPWMPKYPGRAKPFEYHPQGKRHSRNEQAKQAFYHRQMNPTTPAEDDHDKRMFFWSWIIGMTVLAIFAALIGN